MQREITAVMLHSFLPALALSAALCLLLGAGSIALCFCLLAVIADQIKKRVLLVGRIKGLLSISYLEAEKRHEIRLAFY